MTASFNTQNDFYVVHPLDDCPEVKRCADALGPMPMTPSVKWSLISLQCYLALMLFLVAYNSLNLSGLLGHVR
jgi:hypothetical protein